MSRLPLIHIPGGIYSVVSKCNNGEFLFDSKDKFELYIRHLRECKEIFKFMMYDIACVSNHVHELYQIPEDGCTTISDILQRVKGVFSKIYNSTYGRKNHFWKNKPFYRIVQNEPYVIATMHYYHWNPVRAGLAQHPSQWPFSGYHFHELGQRNGLIGKLLDPLPSYYKDIPQFKLMKGVAKILDSKRMRFIGDRQYCKSMRSKYGTK